MSVKNKPIYECDHCHKEIESPVITTHDVPHEGASEITYQSNAFVVGGQHYCSEQCLFAHIKKELGL